MSRLPIMYAHSCVFCVLCIHLYIHAYIYAYWVSISTWCNVLHKLIYYMHVCGDLYMFVCGDFAYVCMWRFCICQYVKILFMYVMWRFCICKYVEILYMYVCGDLYSISWTSL